ncbi:glycosyltransferase [Micromonospora halophytica]|uniref:Glycosyltransferase, MGT family n=1 Tax=Micromonospora halophytica TaxID=47864 RepID=A0A1C5JE59_9ACTN|nr:glycosyltransferase [Micromonospora halophytica]SCG68855.1 glycosyltransferase, MGT family [Micromonospora halophytica]
MRLLFTSLASVGHTYPLIPLAIAARDAGHEVHFAAGEAVHAPLAANGLRPFRPADAFYDIYAEDLEPELARLRPDLVVHEWGLPGAAVAAYRAGIPSIWHGFGRIFPEGIGLELPVANGEVPRLAHLDICPPTLQDQRFLATEDRIALRPVQFSEPGTLPAWGSARGGKPLVYLTLGTVFGTPELLGTVVEGLARVDAYVVVAAGRVRPEQLRDVPDNVSVHAWVPQAELLPSVDVVVHHGGSGTTLGALAVGAPQLVLPQGADQFANADAVSAAGAGLRLLPEEVSAEFVADHVARLLPQHGDGGHRDAARAVARRSPGCPLRRRWPASCRDTSTEREPVDPAQGSEMGRQLGMRNVTAAASRGFDDQLAGRVTFSLPARNGRTGRKTWKAGARS